MVLAGVFFIWRAVLGVGDGQAWQQLTVGPWVATSDEKGSHDDKDPREVIS